MADASVVVELLGKDSASGPIAAVNRELGLMGTSAGNAAQMLGTLAAGAAVAGIGAVGGAFVVSAKNAADFESQISGIASVGGPEAIARMSEISDKALQVGQDTAFSASEAASGMEELIKAGVSIGDVLGPATDATVALAAATGVDLAGAAEIASNAMNQFGLAGEQIGGIADTVAGAANASAIDVNDFKFSLASVGAVANTVGFSFEDTAVAIAEMGQAGIKGSDAGTSLKTMFMSLIPSTDKQKEEFKRLGLETTNVEAGLAALRAKGIEPTGNSWADLNNGVAELLGTNKDLSKLTADEQKQFEAFYRQTGAVGSAFFDASGKVKTMAEVQEVLANATAGMTEQQKLASLEIMFGSDAIRAGAVLAKNGAEGYNDMASAMGQMSAAEVAKTRLDNVNGSIEALKGSMETASIVVGMALLPMIRQVVDGATQMLNANMPMIKQFAADLPGAISAFSAVAIPAVQGVFGFLQANGPAILPILAGIAAGFAFFVGVVGPILGVVSAVTGLVTTFGAAAAGLGGFSGVLAGVVAVLGGPVTIAVVGVVAAVALLTAAWVGNWGDIQGKTAAAWAFIEPILAAIGDGLGQLGAAFDTGGLAGALDKMSQMLTSGLNALAATAMQALAPVGEVIGGFFSGIGTRIRAELDNIGSGVGGFFSSLGSSIQAGLSAIGGFFSELGSVVEAGLATVGAFFSAIGTGAQGMVTAVAAEFDLLRGNIETALLEIGLAIQVGWQTALDLGLALITLFQQTVLGIWMQIPEDIRLDLELITMVLLERFTLFVAMAMQWGLDMLLQIQLAWETISLTIGLFLQTIWDAVILWTTNVLLTITTWLTMANDTMLVWWTTITTTISTALVNIFTAITTQLAAWLLAITTWTANVMVPLVTWGAAALNLFTVTMLAIWTAITTKLTEILTGFTTWAGSVMATLTSWGQQATGKAAETGAGMFEAITSALGAVMRSLGEWAGDVIGMLGALAKDAANAAESVGEAIIKGIITSVKAGADALGDALKAVVRSAIDAAKEALGLDNDTGEVTRVGRGIIDEIIIGAQGQAGKLGGALGDIVSNATAGLGALAGGAISAVTGGFAVSVPGNVTDWITQAVAIGGFPQSWIAPMTQLAMLESGGNPGAYNPTDVGGGQHAQGLLQTIPSTFAAYALPGYNNILNPVDNAIASMRYIQSGGKFWLGDPFNVLKYWAQLGGYAKGGPVTDTGMAMVHQGEYVLREGTWKEYSQPSWSEVTAEVPRNAGPPDWAPAYGYRYQNEGGPRPGSDEFDYARLARELAAAIGRPVQVNGHSTSDVVKAIERSHRRRRMLDVDQASWSMV